MAEVRMYRLFDEESDLRRWFSDWQEGSVRCTDGFYFGQNALGYSKNQLVPNQVWDDERYQECDVYFGANRWSPTLDDLLRAMRKNGAVIVELYPEFDLEGDRDELDMMASGNIESLSTPAQGVGYLFIHNGIFRFFVGTEEEANQKANGNIVLTVWYRKLIPEVSVELRTGFGLFDPEAGCFTKDEWIHMALCQDHEALQSDKRCRLVADGQHRHGMMQSQRRQRRDDN